MIMRFFLIVMLFSAFVSNGQTNKLLPMNQRPASLGEEITFKLSFGWFTVGEATMKTQDKYDRSGGENRYKMEIKGETSGILGAFSKIDDTWGATLDRNSYRPYYAYRDISEGNYRLDERVYFDYKKKKVTIDTHDVNTREKKTSNTFNLKTVYTFDLIGGMMYARSFDFRKIRRGDTIRVNAFFDKKFYDFAMIYEGLENTRTKVGRVNCHKITPIVPQNSIFEKGEDKPVSFWVSADQNRLPLKIEAKMRFGSAYCELIKYKNVKSGGKFEY